MAGLNGIRTHDLCDTGVVLYQLSYQANLELVTLRDRNTPVDGEEYKWIYKRSYIWTAERDMKTWLIIAIIHISCVALNTVAKRPTMLRYVALKCCDRLAGALQNTHKTWMSENVRLNSCLWNAFDKS